MLDWSLMKMHAVDDAWLAEVIEVHQEEESCCRSHGNHMGEGAGS